MSLFIVMYENMLTHEIAELAIRASNKIDAYCMAKQYLSDDEFIISITPDTGVDYETN